MVITNHEARRALVNIIKAQFLTSQGDITWYNITTNELTNNKDARRWIKVNKGKKNTRNAVIGLKDDILQIMTKIKELTKKDSFEYIWVASLVIPDFENMGYNVIMLIEQKKTLPKIITKEEADDLYNHKEVINIKRSNEKGFRKYDGTWVQFDRIFKIKGLGKTYIMTKETSWMIVRLKKADKILNEFLDEEDEIKDFREESSEEEGEGFNAKSVDRNEIIIVKDYTNNSSALILQDRERIAEDVKKFKGKRKKFPDNIGNSNGWIFPIKKYNKVVKELKKFNLIKKTRKELGTRVAEEESEEEDIIAEPIEMTDGPISQRGTCKGYQKFKNSKAEIDERRHFIHDELIEEGYVSKDGMLKEEDYKNNLLVAILIMYDANFFDGVLIREFKEKDTELIPRWNLRMTSTAGVCRKLERNKKICFQYIEIAKLVIQNTFRPGETSHNSGGLICTDTLYCVQLIFEHELIHAIMKVLCKEFESHGERFKKYLRNAFGHTESTHQLKSGDAEELKILQKKREKRAKHVRRVLYIDDIATIAIVPKKGAKEVDVKVKSVRGTKNFTAFNVVNPVRYWKVIAINDIPVTGYQDVLDKEISLKDLREEDKAVVIRENLRKFGNRGVGVKIEWTDVKGKIKKGTVKDTKGKNATSGIKNANVVVGRKEIKVEYVRIVKINNEFVK